MYVMQKDLLTPIMGFTFYVSECGGLCCEVGDKPAELGLNHGHLKQ